MDGGAGEGRGMHGWGGQMQWLQQAMHTCPCPPSERTYFTCNAMQCDATGMRQPTGKHDDDDDDGDDE